MTGLRIAVTADETVAVFPLTGLRTEAAAVAAESYRREGGWRLRAVGQGWERWSRRAGPRLRHRGLLLIAPVSWLGQVTVTGCRTTAPNR
ncbi:TerD family protein [Frankia sp. EI5c]|uniref:TerD family protein n=1 Tax=Frankia sp. EI5c TaxID=683316 RepID=UPI000FF89311|nr:TerD family protein [Frankia sp. EI5c]